MDASWIGSGGLKDQNHEKTAHHSADPVAGHHDALGG